MDPEIPHHALAYDRDQVIVALPRFGKSPPPILAGRVG
jgi:hypothetical protein